MNAPVRRATVEVAERVSTVVTINAEGQACMDARYWQAYAKTANQWKARAEALQEALVALVERVEMDESVGVCLTSRVESLNAIDILGKENHGG